MARIVGPIRVPAMTARCCAIVGVVRGMARPGMSAYDTTDQALLVAWQAGDQHAGATLFERHYDGIHRFFASKVPHAADDLVQRTFLACLEARDRFRGDSSLRTYLFGIAHNTLRHFLRGREQSEAPLDSAMVSAAELAPGPATMLGQRQEQRLLLRALRHIPLDYQLVLELHYWEQQSTSEIAEITGLPVGTIKTRLRRGRQLLQEQIAALAESTEERESTLGGFEGWIRALPKPAAAMGG